MLEHLFPFDLPSSVPGVDKLRSPHPPFAQCPEQEINSLKFEVAENGLGMLLGLGMV